MGRIEEERSFYSDLAVELGVGVLLASALGLLVEHLKTLPDIGSTFSGILPYIAVGFICSALTAVVCNWRYSGRIRSLCNERDKLESLLLEYEKADRDVKVLRGIRRRLADDE